MKRARLPGRGGKQALERFVADLASEPLDYAHPLWQIHIIEKFEGGAAVVFRIHHAVADGISLVWVTLSLVDGQTTPHTAGSSRQTTARAGCRICLRRLWLRSTRGRKLQDLL